MQQAVRAAIEIGCHLVLTTGGTGLGPRDITPEALREIARCDLPGFGETMRRQSERITPHAMLSRCLAILIEHSLVIGLPGKPGAAAECLSFIAAAIPHAIDLIHGNIAH